MQLIFRFVKTRFQFRVLQQLLVLAPLALAPTAFADPPSLSANPDVSNDGKVVLEFEKTENAEIELQQATDPDFTDALTRYRGADPASVLTGLAEGDYYFRIRLTSEENWSAPVRVRVKFMKRGQLYLLLGTGLVVVAMIVLTILLGASQARRSASAAP